MVTFKVNGKLTIDFHPTPPPTASPPAAAPGAPPATPPAAPAQEMRDKDKVLKAVRQSLQDQQARDNQKIVEDVDQLYEGLQQHIRELEDQIDAEDCIRMRKRRRDH